MFSHPALLRELRLLGDFLRSSGEARRARRVAALGDELPRMGWTAAAAAAARSALFDGEDSLDRLSFGVEHHRFVGGEDGCLRARRELERRRRAVREWLDLPPAPGSGGEPMFLPPKSAVGAPTKND